MKKRLLIGALVLSVAFSLAAFRQPASAACAKWIYVGVSGYIPACPNASLEERVEGYTVNKEEDKITLDGIEGFSINIEKNKITLNNYNGGAIYYLCNGNVLCGELADMEIELIGENTISSEHRDYPGADSSSFKDAALVGIVPTFTGNGTLKIEAKEPIARSDKDFTVEIIGSDFAKTASEAEVDIPTDGKQEENKKTDTTESFFETTLGVALLIAVPSLLIIIIVILFVALINKGKNTSNSANNIPNNN